MVIFGMDSMVGIMVMVGIGIFIAIIIVFLTGMSRDRNRKWTKNKAKEFIQKGNIDREKEYWLVRDNLQTMQENDSEARFLLDKIIALKT